MRPVEYAQAVLELVEGEPFGRAGIQLAVFEVAGQERVEDGRVQAVVGGPQRTVALADRGWRLVR